MKQTSIWFRGNPARHLRSLTQAECLRPKLQYSDIKNYKGMARLGRRTSVRCGYDGGPLCGNVDLIELAKVELGQCKQIPMRYSEGMYRRYGPQYLVCSNGIR